jgi:hypothetical protein
MDEKGFMIGILQSSRRYFNAAEAKSKRLKGAGQDGNREFVTVIASVCQEGLPPPPAIIYAAATNNHQDTWYEDLTTSEAIAHFITSPNGWTNDDIGYEWLTQVFDRHTKQKARNGRDYRLLFLDGHSSHLNMRFIEFCDQNKIMLMAYPPHSTHRLQPLDVSLFNPLANYYSQNLDEWLRKSHGICSMSKRHFWSLFKPAFDLAFSENNTASAWRKTGLYPLDEEVILSQVQITDSRPSSVASSASAFSASSWKRAHKHFNATYGPANTRAELKVFNTLDYLSAKSQLQDIEIEGLKERLALQERSSKRRQPLFAELRAQTDNKAIFFSPAKIQLARDLLAQREQEKRDEAQRKQAERDRKAEDKLQRQIEVIQKRELRTIAKAERLRQEAERKLAKELAKEETRLQKLADEQLHIQSRLNKKSKPPSPVKEQRYTPYKKPVKLPEVQKLPEPGPSRSRPRRRLPARFCN